MGSKLLGYLVITLLIGLLGYFFIGLFNKSYAFTMSNDDFILQLDSLNMLAGESSGNGYTLNQTAGELVPGAFSGTNYNAFIGFQYVHSIIPFIFTVSSNSISFGSLDANSPVLRTQTLQISNGSAYGYNVYASENHPLQSGSNTIPDTTCDNGSCTQTISAPWINTLTYGFGYRCDNVVGTDCASGFSGATNYKQFSDSSIHESAQSVMGSQNVGRNRQVQITYKINISATQPGGTYNNTITYLAIPSY